MGDEDNVNKDNNNNSNTNEIPHEQKQPTKEFFIHSRTAHRSINKVITEENRIQKIHRMRGLYPFIHQHDTHILYEVLREIDKTLFDYDTLPKCERFWFRNLVTIAENLPICVTVSSAKKEQPGFPLIYVNKQFENVTQYSRREVLGHNCKFLQPKKTLSKEVFLHKTISYSLMSALPISVIITNQEKGGEYFQNLISLKPIKGGQDNSEYLYVLGVQNPFNKYYVADVQNVIDILHILSNIPISISEKETPRIFDMA